MAKSLLPDNLWAVIAPLLPPEPPKPTGGRPRIDDRQALTGIVFVLGTGIAWERLPVGHDPPAPVAGLARGRRVGAVAPGAARPAGDRQRHRLAPGRARQRRRPGQNRGDQTGPNPTERGRPGTKRDVLTDRAGIPLAVRLGPANTPDSRLFEPLIDAVPPIRQCSGRPRRRPAKRHADKGYDFPHCRRACRRRRVTRRIARRGVDSSERLGRHRWIVERTLAWFSRYRRLTSRYERKANVHLASTLLAASLIGWNFIQRWFC